MKNHIGIMQGRLSPRYNGRYQAFSPEHWKQEFGIAGSLGFDCIEFIYDYENFHNSPLITPIGLNEIKETIESSGVGVSSVCADYFMKFTLFAPDDLKRKNNKETLINLLERVSSIGVKDVTLPCVDDSSLKSEKDMELFKESINDILPFADQYWINLNLETDLPPESFRRLLMEINHPRIKVNYDIGNSAALGYNPEEELDCYGQYISVLHIKDRLYKGGSVRLGTGNANFKGVFNRLKQIDFKGVIIMQAARANDDSKEIAFVKEQYDFLKESLERWYL